MNIGNYILLIAAAICAVATIVVLLGPARDGYYPGRKWAQRMGILGVIMVLLDITFLYFSW